MALVRPIQSFAVEVDGAPTVFNPDRILEDTHDVVRRYPTLFEAVEPHPADRVEQATAAPGERRNARPRTRTTTADDE